MVINLDMYCTTALLILPSWGLLLPLLIRVLETWLALTDLILIQYCTFNMVNWKTNLLFYPYSHKS